MAAECSGLKSQKTKNALRQSFCCVGGLVLAAAWLSVISSLPAAASTAESAACADSFTNTSGGPWSTGASWSTGSTPTATQAACITAALSGPVTLSGSGIAESLTLGSSSIADTLQMSSATLQLSGNSTIESKGLMTASSGSSTIEVARGAKLVNDGVLTDSATLTTEGAITNAAAGSTGIAAGATLNFDGRFKNLGAMAIGRDGSVGGTAPVVENSGGEIVNGGTFEIGTGGTLKEGNGVFSGPPPVVDNGTLDLVGKGAASIEVEGTTTLSGTVAPSQNILLDTSGPAMTKGILINEGSISTYSGGGSTLSIPAGSELDNTGRIFCDDGRSLTIDGGVDNETAGTITAGGDGNASGCTIHFGGPSTLTNDGVVWVAPYSAIATAPGESVNVDNEGSITNYDTVTVGAGDTFEEGSGTVSDEPVTIGGSSGDTPGATLELNGTGASRFAMLGGSTLVGNVASNQQLELQGTVQTGSFTNDGTITELSGWSFTIDMASGDTLTNDGTIGLVYSSQEQLISGNLDNDADGTIDFQGDGLWLTQQGATFDNSGTLNMFPCCGGVHLDNYGQTFDNTGTINYGVLPSSNGSWGDSGQGSAIDSISADDGNPVNTVDLAGTINPVASEWGLPAPSEAPSSFQFDLVGFATGLSVSCSSTVTGGYVLVCPGTEAAGEVVAESNSIPDPTTMDFTESVTAGSGTPTADYGEPVSLTATITQGVTSDAAPTGQVTFYVDGPSLPLILGTADLSTSDGVTSATLTTSSLPPNDVGEGSDLEYQFFAYYAGDTNSAPVSSYTGGSEPTLDVDLEPTSTEVTAITPAPSSVGGEATLTATVTPESAGPANPTGSVAFFAGSYGLFLGSAAVSTDSGVTTATLSTSLLASGSTYVYAEYSGDGNYGESTSLDVDQTVNAGTGDETITAISPANDKSGKTITITGTWLDHVTGVDFGSVAATSFEVVSKGEVTAVAPAQAAGTTVDITVIDPTGTSPLTPADRFTYKN